MNGRPSNLLSAFARHDVAANLFMLIMFVAGLYALSRLNVQFFPDFDVGTINVRVEWRGAAAEDVEEAITTPLEDELRDIDGIKHMNSTSREGLSTISIEFKEGTDMGGALDNVKERISRVRNLPENSEDPQVIRVTDYTPIARVLITGDVPRHELRRLSRDLRDQLLDRGVSKVTLLGLPAQEMDVDVPNAHLGELGISLQTLGQRIASETQDVPAGEAGSADVSRQLRGLGQRRQADEFRRLPVGVDAQGTVHRLGDIAQVKLRPRDTELLMSQGDHPAIEMLLQRGENENALTAAETLDAWLKDARPTLPKGISLKVYDQRWTYIRDRIELLLKNGATGLLLVVAILFLFLNGRVAFWVAMGIPASFLAALAVLYGVGGSINMISLFALIMTLGIIVDDAIVVGEDALAHYEQGERAIEAAEGGARRMLAPVMSSSLTTIAAFLPLMMIGGIIGQVLYDIPLVAICVIFASLVEAFFVLPGHLRASFLHMHHARAGGLRHRIDRAFNNFRDGPFRRWVRLSVEYRWVTLSIAVAMLIMAFGLLIGGRLPFTFFQGVEGNLLYANVHFVAGTPRERVEQYLDKVDAALQATNKHFGGDLIVNRVSRAGSTFDADPRLIQYGEHYGAVFAELVSPDARDVRNADFIRYWKAHIPRPPGLENLVIKEPEQGPPGSPIDVELTGADVNRLKQASEALQNALQRYPGVSAVEDDLPYGQEQWIYHLKPEARTLGLTTAAVGRQLRDAFSGYLAQIYQDGQNEIELRVRLPESQTRFLGRLNDFELELPGGGKAPLTSVVDLTSRRGFETLRHTDGRLAVHVTADVDTRVNNANRILASLQASKLPELRTQYGVKTDFAGRAEDQAQTLSDMEGGLVLALALIYLILAWVFGSYGWPLVVMAVIPFGLIGAFLGHWLMGLDVTILSLFGLFGLTGIVVNDSIVLVTFFKHLRRDGHSVDDALVDAARLRLRAVLLTSLTTIGGLLPLLFETSLQAQFLIPMAVSITFGLAGTTLLVLFMVPAMLSIHEDFAGWLKGKFSPRHRTLRQLEAEEDTR